MTGLRVPRDKLASEPCQSVGGLSVSVHARGGGGTRRYRWGVAGEIGAEVGREIVDGVIRRIAEPKGFHILPAEALRFADGLLPFGDVFCRR
jgi:hypothetical protein